MKTIYHVPTEQYGFIELELENGQVPSDDMIKDAVSDYRRISEASKAPEGVGLTAKELDLIIEHMCLGKTVENGTNLWDKATQGQKDQINCLKRALNRIKSKQGKSNDKYEDKQGYSGQLDD